MHWTEVYRFLGQVFKGISLLYYTIVQWNYWILPKYVQQALRSSITKAVQDELAEVPLWVFEKAIVPILKHGHMEYLVDFDIRTL